MKEKYILDEFEFNYPSLYADAIDFIPRGPYGMIVKTKEGKVFDYYVLDNTISPLPPDSKNMSNEERQKLFGKSLYRIMYRFGVSQAELARETGITQTMLSRYITGKSNPSFCNVDKIIKTLGCSYKELTYDY